LALLKIALCKAPVCTVSARCPAMSALEFM
jgi:hypothetical protein